MPSSFRPNGPFRLTIVKDASTIYHKVQEQASKATDNVDIFSLVHALENASTGAAGTAVSNVVTYPLDLVCTRLQVQNKSQSSSGEKVSDKPRYDGVLDAIQKIYKREGGLRAFYSGVESDTADSVINSFLFFFTYNILWRMRKKYGPKVEHPMLQAIDGISVGFVTGAFTKALTAPIQNVVKKQQIQDPGEEQTVTEITNDIYKKKGLAGFWNGYSSSLILTFNPALTFFFDAALRRVLMRNGGEPGPATTFILAANGKATANILTYPFKLVKSRAQVASAGSDDESKSDQHNARSRTEPNNPIASVVHIARTEGLASLYAGIYGEIFKGFFNHGLTMAVKEQIPALVLQLYYMISSLLRRQSKLTH